MDLRNSKKLRQICGPEHFHLNLHSRSPEQPLLRAPEGGACQSRTRALENSLQEQCRQ